MDADTLAVLIDRAIETRKPQEHEGWEVELGIVGEDEDAEQVLVHAPHCDLYAWDEDLERYDWEAELPAARLARELAGWRCHDVSPGEDTETWILLPRPA